MNKCKKRIVITKDDEEKLDKIRQYYINSIIHCLQYKELLSILAVYAVDLGDYEDYFWLLKNYLPNEKLIFREIGCDSGYMLEDRNEWKRKYESFWANR